MSDVVFSGNLGIKHEQHFFHLEKERSCQHKRTRRMFQISGTELIGSTVSPQVQQYEIAYFKHSYQILLTT
jgi:hypothetical protein